MCLTPITLTRNYRKLGERWSNAADRVPCGKCIACRRRRSSAWAFRLEQEQKVSETALFITLTYADTPRSFNGNMTLDKRDFQLFMKRLRKQNQKKLKYYACGEYGSKFKRPHYHMILFNLTGKIEKKLTKAWTNGFVDIGNCEPASIRYTTNYITKSIWEPENELDDREKEFSLMSKKLGLSYLTPAMVQHHTSKLIGCVTRSGGQLQGLPRYFKNKIFSSEERKKIAQEMRELTELNVEKHFGLEGNNTHIQWKKDQERKERKNRILERQSL